MRIKEFLKEKNISVGDNARLLLEALSIDNEELLKKIEAQVGEVAKMSKSKGNTVDPEAAVEKYGADTVRLYVLFAGPPEQDFEWTEEGIQGAYRFLNRLWNFVTAQEEELRRISYSREELRNLQGKAKDLRREIHTLLKEYFEDMEKRFQFNTAIAKSMKLLNLLSDFRPSSEEDKKVLKEGVEILLSMLSPITPHICEELWSRLGHEELITLSPFPEVDQEALKVEEIEIPVQINGKLRGKIRIPYNAGQETALEEALRNDKIAKHIGNKKPKKVIFVKNRLLNIVV